MRYVYVLTSTNEDCFLEECLISMMSLKKYNPAVEVDIYIDDITETTLSGKRRKIYELANVNVIQFEKNVNMKMRSRFLKIRLREYINGDFLYIDSDTVIVDKLDFCVSDETNIGMVLDAHVRISDNPRSDYIRYNAEKLDYHEGYEDKHFNGGVFYSKDSAVSREFFKTWEELYVRGVEKGVTIDQTSLNEANYRLGGVIDELEGKWNVQLNTGLNFFSNGKIYHYAGYQPGAKMSIYYNTIPFSICEKNVFEEVKECGDVTPKIISIIESPKSSFKQSYILPRDCIAYDLLFSNHMRVMKFFYVKFRRLFEITDKLYGKLFLMKYKRP